MLIKAIFYLFIYCVRWLTYLLSDSLRLLYIYIFCLFIIYYNICNYLSFLWQKTILLYFDFKDEWEKTLSIAVSDYNFYHFISDYNFYHFIITFLIYYYLFRFLWNFETEIFSNERISVSESEGESQFIDLTVVFIILQVSVYLFLVSLSYALPPEHVDVTS